MVLFLLSHWFLICCLWRWPSAWWRGRRRGRDWVAGEAVQPGEKVPQQLVPSGEQSLRGILLDWFRKVVALYTYPLCAYKEMMKPSDHLCPEFSCVGFLSHLPSGTSALDYLWLLLVPTLFGSLIRPTVPGNHCKRRDKLLLLQPSLPISPAPCPGPCCQLWENWYRQLALNLSSCIIPPGPSSGSS